MTVAATKTEAITITPNAVRYGVVADRLDGTWTGKINLQRAQRDDPGLWIDDPRADAKVSVAIPASCHAALDGLLVVLPDIVEAEMPNITLNSVGDVRLRLKSTIQPDKTLDVNITVQVRVIRDQWIAHQISSLKAVLAANPALAAGVMSAWATLDAAVDAANAVEEWV
jgi:hypothetical protein